jgi:CHAT domain-containing protein
MLPEEDGRRIFWIPPSTLGGLPLEALPTTTGQTGSVPVSFGGRHPISRLPAASALQYLGQPSGALDILVFADPEIRADSAMAGVIPSTFRYLAAPLPYAREEGRAVSRGGKVLIGRKASREAFLSGEARDAGVLHFATHALVTPQRPENSALVLAGDNPFVTAAEVESLDLSADLVTLSGCRTGTGYTTLSEGTFGLVRSFLVSGARAVVSSLWDVDDRATSEFMKYFYADLRRGKPPDESLGRAREQMRLAKWPARDWAAFVLTGAGDLPVASLSTPGNDSLPVVGRTLAGLGILLFLGTAWAVRKKFGRNSGPGTQ